jgi:hypothetical protein
MADLDSAHQDILPTFGWQQWKSNRAGIGNECTHWIYAALLEARALDTDRALHIQQARDHYTWGRAIEPRDMIAGDILQFKDFRNEFSFYFKEADGGWRVETFSLLRGPLHTAMCAITQSHTFNGQFLVLESHLHDPAYAVMTIRDSRVYNANFSISMTTAQFARAKTDGTFANDLDWSDRRALAVKPAWLRIRDRFETDDAKAAAAFQRMARRQDPKLGDDVAFMMRLHTTGRVRFFRPQASPARLAMDAAAFAAEKARVIAMMIRSGRPGEAETRTHSLDQYDSDNKRARVRDHYFDWKFSPASP